MLYLFDEFHFCTNLVILTSYIYRFPDYLFRDFRYQKPIFFSEATKLDAEATVHFCNDFPKSSRNFRKNTLSFINQRFLGLDYRCLVT
jgi:hypothetical protein